VMNHCPPAVIVLYQCRHAMIEVEIGEYPMLMIAP
jgi:hypothetical protein